MAKAKKLPSGSWRCQVYSHSEPVYDKSGAPALDKNGKQKQKRIYVSFTCDDPSPKGKRTAEKKAAAWAADKETMTTQKKYDKTLGEALDDYINLRSAVLSPSTIREYKRSRKQDLQGLMNMRLYSITQEDVQTAINQEALSHSPKSVRNMHGLLSAVMATYRPNFSLHTDMPKKIRPKMHIPSDQEVQRLMDLVAGTPLEVPVLLAAFGPMRRGEICALDSDHITGNIVHVEYSLALNEHNEWIKKSPKSIAGDRYIEFPDFVIQKISGKTGRIVELSPSQLSDQFAKMIKRSDLPDFRFHDLRHYSASIQHTLGVPDAYIMRRGGWGNDSVLKNVYRHAMESEVKAMNAKANAHFESLCNTKCNTK